MSSTTVHSDNKNEKNTPCVAGSVFQPTEKTLEVPPKGQVYEVISSYIEEQGNIEIPAEKDESVLEVSILSPEAIRTIISYKKERDEKKAKLKEKVKVSSKAGAEIGE